MKFLQHFFYLLVLSYYHRSKSRHHICVKAYVDNTDIIPLHNTIYAFGHALCRVSAVLAKLHIPYDSERFLCVIVIFNLCSISFIRFRAVPSEYLNPGIHAQMKQVFNGKRFYMFDAKKVRHYIKKECDIKNIWPLAHELAIWRSSFDLRTTHDMRQADAVRRYLFWHPFILAPCNFCSSVLYNS